MEEDKKRLEALLRGTGDFELIVKLAKIFRHPNGRTASGYGRHFKGRNCRETPVSIREGPETTPSYNAMTDQTPFLVFFSCLYCKAVYYATQKREPSIVVGRFTCKSCNTTVQQWWGTQYSFTDWKGPLELRQPRRPN
jgi:hypothetical protein